MVLLIKGVTNYGRETGKYNGSQFLETGIVLTREANPMKQQNRTALKTNVSYRLTLNKQLKSKCKHGM